MTSEALKVRDVPPTVLRLPPEMRARLQRDAKANGRSLTKEIEMHLQRSLEASGYPDRGAGSPAAVAAEPGGYGLSETETALLQVLRKLSPEKQLALLSLLR